ncbi:hypothetical protein ACLKMH_17435 [Psychromonas sp. KJ10-10]|uniref:hypothetical protein n=1 Tax=Psychromonas sp. KJ10-10 TaxID=3391823 RepID=UPI0039B46432
MYKQTFLITGGFFDGSSEGYIGKITLEQTSNRVLLSFTPLLITEPPAVELRVKNKGFAGGSINGNLLWICSSNQVLAYSLENFELIQTIDDPLFNDLHHVLAEENGLYVVNTGLESLDYFNYDGVLKERKFLTSEERNIFRINSTAEFRTFDSKPHFMHANHCSRSPEGNMLLTFVRQRRIVNLSDWSWASPEYSAPPHEGFIDHYAPKKMNCIWVSTVPGEVLACDPISHEVIKKWNLREKGVPPGWTRGLCILKHGFLVGTTKIRQTNADYYARWNSEETNKSETTVSYISFDEKQEAISVDVLGARNAKIFSILPFEKAHLPS